MGRGSSALVVLLAAALSLASPAGVRAQEYQGYDPEVGGDDSSSWGTATGQSSPGPQGNPRPIHDADPTLAQSQAPSPPATTPTPAATAPQQAPAPPPEDADPRALTDFKPYLDPYGYWVNDSQYGTVWVPYPSVVGSGFSPYVTGGHWALDTNGDWIWVSDYPFGWAVYHYGRWVYITGRGWAWIPGYRYAPAWVSWRVPTGSYSYVGWAPLPPDYIWVGGSAVWYWSTPYFYWVFAPSAYAFHTHVGYYVVRDPAFVTRLGYSTRYYAPYRPPRYYASGSTRYYGSGSTRYYAPNTSGGRMRVPASPTMSDARVPAQAVPRERLRVTPAPRGSALERAQRVNVAPRTPAAAGVARPASPQIGERVVVPGRSGMPARPQPYAPAPQQLQRQQVQPQQAAPARPPRTRSRAIAPAPAGRVAPTNPRTRMTPSFGPRSAPPSIHRAAPGRMAPSAPGRRR